jgi:hypothetical protein
MKFRMILNSVSSLLYRKSKKSNQIFEKKRDERGCYSLISSDF